jgi:catechol 2,3-dioxygenase
MATRLGPVHIAVTEAERGLAVWRDLVGLTELARSDAAIELGAGGRTLIVLEPGADRRALRHTAGLYHVAIHVPARRDQAVAIARLQAHGFRNSPTDHLVTETTYLWDLDGNGIELTFETPWRGTLQTDGKDFFGVDTDGRRHPGIAPVDLDSMMAELGDAPDLGRPMPAGTRIGHVHVHVDDLKAAMTFYSEVLGFPARMWIPELGMADVGLDYPPHILAFNTWAGSGVKQPPPGTAGLRHFTIELPDKAALAAMRARLDATDAPLARTDGGFATADPAGNRILVHAIPSEAKSGDR